MTTPGKPVARVGDVVATSLPPMTGFYPAPPAPPTAKGTWAATGPVSPTAVSTVSAGGAAILIGASCTFTFTGNDTVSGSPVTPPPTSTVTLKPGTPVLRVAGGAPLVHGDTNKDDFGNRLTVVSTATWRTA